APRSRADGPAAAEDRRVRGRGNADLPAGTRTTLRRPGRPRGRRRDGEAGSRRSPHDDLDAAVPRLRPTVPGRGGQVPLPVRLEAQRRPLRPEAVKLGTDPLRAPEAEAVVVVAGSHAVGMAHDADVARSPLRDASRDIREKRLRLLRQLVRITPEV